MNRVVAAILTAAVSACARLETPNPETVGLTRGAPCTADAEPASCDPCPDGRLVRAGLAGTLLSRETRLGIARATPACAQHASAESTHPVTDTVDAMLADGDETVTDVGWVMVAQDAEATPVMDACPRVAYCIAALSAVDDTLNTPQLRWTRSGARK